MQVTIVGTGNMARGIATRALAGGHDVTIVGTERSKADSLASDLGGCGPGSVQAGDTVGGDVVVLAVPYAAASDVLATHRDNLGGAVIVDITNPVDFSTFQPLSLDAAAAAPRRGARRAGGRRPRPRRREGREGVQHALRRHAGRGHRRRPAARRLH